MATLAPPKTPITPAGFQGDSRGGVTTADGRWDELPAVPDRGVIPENPIVRAQFPEYAGPGRQLPTTGTNPTPGQRRVQIFPRSAVDLQYAAIPSPGGGESVFVISSGVQIRVDGLPTLGAGGPLAPGTGTIDVSADRVVVWTVGNPGDLRQGGTQKAETPLEIYLEGDVIFREGDRVVYAQAMYYNVPLRTGTILNAELLTPVQTFQGLARLRANVIRQIGESHFIAEGASFTTSRLAVPTYEVRSGNLEIDDRQIPLRDSLTLMPIPDPITGEPIYEHKQQVTGTNNVVFAGGIPVFYWPWLRTDAQKPTFYVNDFVYGTDNIFGTRYGIGFDAYQVFGVSEPPRGTSWDFDVGYMDKRGFNAATKFTYNNGDLLGTAQPTRGILDAFYIHDGGLDTLGSDRVNMVPECVRTLHVPWPTPAVFRKRLADDDRSRPHLGPQLPRAVFRTTVG
ncbi:MAG: hypothetical protein QM811_22655 [Pirellulales bacterium]